MTLDQIYQAAFALKGVARETELIRAPRIDAESEVWLKTENLQVTGSFKVRGAYNKISRLTPEEKKRGVIACSAGNHAQGVALAAAKNGIRALICIPQGAPISKVEATATARRCASCRASTTTPAGRRCGSRRKAGRC